MGNRWGNLAVENRYLRTAFLGLIVAFAFASRLYMAVSSPIVEDEYQWFSIADSVDLRPNHFQLPLHGDQHPPGQAYWAAIGTAIFGQNLLGYRFPSAILGTLAVVLIYFVGKLLGGSKTGLIAAFVLAANEYHIGVSRLCTEKNYLTFALLGLLLVEHAFRQPSTRRFLALGAVMGLGILTKQTLALWVPIFGLETLRRRETRSLWRHSAPWWGLLVLLVIVSPDLFWNATAPSSGHAPGDRGLAYQFSRLTLGTWSWGPLALYIRPLYYLIDPEVSSFASMTSVPGGILLTGAIASVYYLRSPLARFLQILGFGTFLFFCFFTSPAGEFWWADITLLPFIALTAAVLGRLRGAGNVVIVAVLAVALISSWRVVTARDNNFPLDWGSYPDRDVEVFKNLQMRLIVTFREQDHLKLCTLGNFRLPVCDFYETSLRSYEKYLLSVESNSIWAPWASRYSLIPPFEVVEQEKAWVRAELERFRVFPSRRQAETGRR